MHAEVLGLGMRRNLVGGQPSNALCIEDERADPPHDRLI
jgi:hypothetical protein